MNHDKVGEQTVTILRKWRCGEKTEFVRPDLILVDKS